MSLQVAILKVLVSHPEGRATIAALNSDLCILNTSGSDWTDRLRRLAARAPGLDIFGRRFVLRDSSGWQITPEGRAFLDWLERGAASANVPLADPSPPPPQHPPLLLVGVTRRQRLTRGVPPKTAFCLRFGGRGHGRGVCWRKDRPRGCSCPRSQPAPTQTLALNAGMSTVSAWP